jgi:DNA-binding response OmpR family regulator
VRAVLRRVEPAPPESQVIELGDVKLDLRTRSVIVGGSSVVLRTLEFELLAELARHPGQVVTRDRLLDRVWGLTFAGGTRTVDVHVAQLRKKLGRADLIQTVRGVGYRILDARVPQKV